MNFDNMVASSKIQSTMQRNQAMSILTKELHIIGCGGNTLGRVFALKKSFGKHEPELYLYMSFGFTLYFGFGERGRYTSSHRGYNVSYQGNGNYKVSDIISYGCAHNFHVAPFGFIDLSKLKNANSFKSLLREAEESLNQFYDLYAKNNKNYQYIYELEGAFYEKIDELSKQAQSECGFSPCATMAQIRARAIKACRFKRSMGEMQAKEKFLSEAQSR